MTRTAATIQPDFTSAAASRLFVAECSKHVIVEDLGPASSGALSFATATTR